MSSSKRKGARGQVTTKVRQALDTEALKEWMVQQPSLVDLIFGGSAMVSRPPPPFSLEVRQFGFGQSNPTYKLKLIWKEQERTFVLRRKPDKVAHASAHALHREFRVLKSLELHNRLCPTKSVPAPQVYAYCTDKSVLGAEFYVMDFVQGRIFTDPSLPGMTPDERRAAYADMLQVMSNLHSVDNNKVGLSTYGKAGGYVERNIQRLMSVSEKQSQLSGSPLPELDSIARQLSRAAPHCPDYTSLLHGDFKVDNMIFSETEPKVIAILDWELSTIGDPLCDLANLSMMFYMPQDKGIGIAGLLGVDIDALGIPKRDELLTGYVKRNSAIDLQLARKWSGFYLAFLFFKNAVIVHGVAQRAKAGVASSAIANRVADLLPTIINMTRSILQQHPPPLASSNL